VSKDTNLVHLLELKVQSREKRLALWWLAMILCAVGTVYSLTQQWYHASFYGTVSSPGLLQADIETAWAQVSLSAFEMAALPAVNNQGVANPAVASVGGIPTFYVFAIAAMVCACFGLFIASSAITGLSVVGFGYAWAGLSSARYGFESGIGKEGWTIVQGYGQQLFGFVFTAAFLIAITGSIQALAFQRAERELRIAKGQEVEESFAQRLERILTRGGPARHDPVNMSGG